MRGAPHGPNALRHAEHCLEALATTKLATREKVTLLALVDDLVFGHALRQPRARSTSVVKKLIASGTFPRLAATFARGGVALDARRLERGLDALLQGFSV